MLFRLFLTMCAVLFAVPAMAGVRHVRPALPVHAFVDYAPAPVGVARVADVALQFVGSGKFTKFPGAWCRDAVNAWLARAGFKTNHDRTAASVVRIGRPIARPVPGALAYTGRHVGVVIAVEGHKVRMVSGNWSHRVCMHVSSVHCWRYVLPIARG